MGHEYRTPLSSILGLLELALLQTIPDEVRRYIVEAQNSARELLTTVSDIIEFTELETSHFVNRPKRFSLKNLLDRIISLVTRQANEKRVVIASRVSDSVSSFVTADEQRIGQILLNTMLFVLENATPRGGIVIFVDNLSDPLVADIGSATIGISIGYWDDTISDDSVKRLFATITNSQEKWIGSALIPRLRLSLVARVIDCLGGGINLHHVPRCGLRIEVRIPVSVEVEEDLTSPRIESELIDPELSKNLRVLVAEDNAVNARVITHMLEHLNTPFVLVQNGAEAVRAFEHDIKGFDLILMDCQMPEFDGFEATKAIRLIEQERHTHTPIIAMTAYALPGDRELCYQAGMDGYLSKPISAKQLSSTLQSSK
jgi:CheY-like chemotaxis protein